jgi:probable LLM family oxidoreductase
MELGIYTFGVTGRDPRTGEHISPAQRMANLLEEIELADHVGLDVFGVGEHHRPEFVVSSPQIVLAAAAARTKRIRLTSAVTVLSSSDPVRVFQDFAHVDLISDGRAEIMAGRGSFIESFPLFGKSLDDYDDLFGEHLDLLLALRSQNPVTWHGRHRPPLENADIQPRPVQDPLPVWVAVGGNPPSVIRAGMLGLPMALAIIGGEPARFAPLVELHREALSRAGHDPQPVSLNLHGYVADDARRAADDWFPSYAELMSALGRERGWPPLTRRQYDQSLRLRGASVVGGPQEVAEKILWQHEIFGHDRTLLQFSVGPLPHADVMRSIELFGTAVAPIVREEVARRADAAGSELITP